MDPETWSKAIHTVMGGGFVLVIGTVVTAYIKWGTWKRKDRKQEKVDDQESIEWNIKMAREHASRIDKQNIALAKKFSDMEDRLEQAQEDHLNCLQQQMANTTKIEAQERHINAQSEQIDSLIKENAELRERVRKLEERGYEEGGTL